jgi:hypothetical protein
MSGPLRASFLVALCLLTAGPAAGQGAASSPAKAWNEVLLADLKAARDRIASSHPGAVDTSNPAFARTLTAAYDEAVALAPHVQDYNAYRIALRRFGNRFQDGHLYIDANRPFDGGRTAGIVVQYRDRGFVVADADARYGPLQGATLLSCDGRPARAVFERQVLSWRGRPAIEADWYTHAPYYFVHYTDLLGPAPRACEFQQGREKTTVTLDWQPIDTAKMSAAMAKATSFGSLALSLDRLDDGRVLWVNLPTFAPRDAAAIETMNGLIAKLREEFAANKTWQLVVFDLRDNSGGSSAWGDQILRAVYGDDYGNAVNRYLGDGVYTEWRVSAENLDAVNNLVTQLTARHGADSANVAGMKSFQAQMSAALARGDRLLPTGNTKRTGVPRPTPPAVPGRVVAITSTSCFSACLDFMDRLKVDPALIHVGEPTGVDTVYMENWGGPLPSGVGTISHPMKVYRNRRRGNNEGYTPQVLYSTGLRDTAALRTWVLSRYRR